ncbi:unnamed protein product [Arctogadus glacialis]
MRVCACDSRLFPCSPVPWGGALHGLAAATLRSSGVAARFHDCGGSSQTTSDLCSPANHSLAPEGSGEGGEHNHFSSVHASHEDSGRDGDRFLSLAELGGHISCNDNNNNNNNNKKKKKKNIE